MFYWNQHNNWTVEFELRSDLSEEKKKQVQVFLVSKLNLFWKVDKEAKLYKEGLILINFKLLYLY
jgi:hypothetical protein